MVSSRSLARGATVLCCAWPLLFLQLQPQKLEAETQPPHAMPEGGPLVLPGVVIEEIPEDSALQRAGIQPGDLILTWERLPNPPANQEGASGTIESPFDWMWLETEQAPRGVVRLQGMRRGSPMSWQIGNGIWGAVPSPGWPFDTTAPGGRSGSAQFTLDRQSTPRKDSHSLFIWSKSAAQVREWSMLSSARKCRAEACRTLAELSLSRLATKGSSHRVRLLAWRELSSIYESWGQTQLAVEALWRFLNEAGVSAVLSTYVRSAPSQLPDSTDSVVALCGNARSYVQVFQTVSQQSSESIFAIAAALNKLGRLSRHSDDPAVSCGAFVAALDLLKSQDSVGLLHASVLNNLGVLAEALGNLKISEALHQEAYRLRQNAQAGRQLLATSLNNLGQIALMRREPSVAVELLSQAKELLRFSDPSSLLTTVVKENLANSFAEAGDLDRAAALQAEVIGDRRGMAPGSPYYSVAFFNMGNIEMRRGNLSVAESYLRRALEVRRMFAATGDSLANTLTSLGIVSMNRGDLYEAESYFLEAMDALSERGMKGEGMEVILNNLGIVANVRGDHEMAKAFYARSLQMERDAGSGDVHIAETINNIANAEADLGNRKAARLLYLEAIGRLEDSSPQSFLVPELYLNLGLLDMEAGEGTAAREHLRMAERLLLARGISGPKFALLIKTIADLELSLGRHLKAKMGYEKAIAAMDEVHATGFFVTNALQRLAEISEKYGDVNAAAIAWDRTVDSLESQFREIDTMEAIRSTAPGHYAGVFRGAIARAIDDGHEEKALSILERFKAHGLRRLLIQRAGRKQSAQETPPMHALKLYASIAEGKVQWSDSGVHDQEADSPEAELRGLLPRQPGARIIGQASDEEALRQLASSLDLGTIVLAFLTGNQKSYLFMLSGEGDLHLVRLPVGDSELRQRVERFRELIPLARPGSALGELRLAELRQLGKELYDILLKPAEAEIEKAERVMIVADGPLHYLPFATLTRAVVGEDGVKHDQYLAEWKPFHSVLSATVFAEIKKDRRDPSKPDDGTALQFVAFGDPVFPNSVTAKEPDKIGDIRVRSAARRGALELAPLPYTRREVEGIAALFPPGRVQTYFGAEATEEKAKAIGKGARILHFATHTRLDDRFPLNSSLLLSLPEGFPEDRENGLLQVWEVFERMRLDADLVVLSACESGLGQEQGGEGLIGLTRAFQYAGARTVIASLWEVRDEATAELMIRFYRHFTAGKPKDQALQAAQRELLAGPIEIPGADGKPILFDATSPYYWAAFQVIGDWQ